MRASVSIVLIAALLLAVPAGARLHAEGDGAQVVIKVATMIPRTPDVAIQEKRYNQRLQEATGGRIQFKTYFGGSAGDDHTVMRKMRSGQIDGAPLGVDVVAQFVRQCTILMAPQTFFNYKQVDAVREALSPTFNKEAWENGFKIMSWWDGGRVRIFSKTPVRTFDDLRKGRPWLYPESALLKEFYKMISVTGVPLDLNEVYGGLTTNMIDTVWISSVLGTAFRWTSQTHFVSATPVDVIQGAFLLRKETWEGLSKADQKVLDDVMAEQSVKTIKQFREDDEKTFVKLQTHGLTPFTFANEKEWADVGEKLRLKMVGRTYSKELLDKVEAITKKFPGTM
ncbi:MAG TPA: TRAP transporter substrate-binding protein DctP [Polyangiales bacterium]